MFDKLRKYFKQKKNSSLDSFTQKQVTKLVNWGIFWVCCSYALAFISVMHGKNTIAESLSESIVKLILGVFIANAAKALFENIHKYPNVKTKKKKRTPVSDTTDAPLETGNEE